MTHLFTIDSARAGHVDINKATRLTDVAFKCWLRPTWILAALRTITRDHRELKRITLAVLSPQGLNDHYFVKDVVGEDQGWLELDRTLVQLSESHSIRLRLQVDYRILMSDNEAKGMMERLLPEVTARGVANMDEWGDGLYP